MFRLFWLICGIILLIVGIVGLVLPLIPTTPFILLAAASFAKGSNKFHNYLINNKYSGPIITDWQKNRTIPLRAKIVAALMMCISIFSIIVFIMHFMQ